MKRLLAIFSLFIMLYNTAGYYIAFQVFHKQVKKQLWKQSKAKTARQQLILIKEKKQLLKNGESRLKFLDHGKEIKKDAELYDIVFSEEAGDEIHYYCVNDRQEQELMAQLEKKVQEDNGAPASNSKSLLKAMAKDYLPVSPDEIFKAISSENKFNAIPEQHSAVSAYLAINIPPPDSFSGKA